MGNDFENLLSLKEIGYIIIVFLGSIIVASIRIVYLIYKISPIQLMNQ